MKFMNLKRFASTALAGVMAVSMMTPALAADDQTIITATYAETELAVTVPGNVSATINPYGLPVTMEDAVTTLSGQPITIATPLMIENQSSVALKVGANVKAEVTGLTLAAAKTGVDTGTTKQAYVELQLFEASGVDGASAADPTVTNPLYANLKDGDAVLKAVLDASAANGVDAAGSKDLVLREGADSLSQNGGVAFVRLSGVVAKKPTTAWEPTDKLIATVTYSFEPSTYAKSAGTIAGAGGATTVANGGTLQLTLTTDLPSDVTVTTWTWASSDENAATVVALTDTKNATVTNKVASASGTADGSADITVSGLGSDGITYSAKITLTCTGNP